MLTTTTIGVRVCISLLDDMLKLYNAEEATEGAQAFDVGYDILTQLVEHGLVADLYNKFAIPDEIVTPHQTTLLKIVDSYLQSVQMNATSPATRRIVKTHRKLSPTLANSFFDLSTYAQQAVERALVVRAPTSADPYPPSADGAENIPGSDHYSPPVELDVMLPRVCEALVLITQCIVTITLEADQQKHLEAQNDRPEQNMKTFFNKMRSSGQGLVESLIELLRLLDLFLPRINFGKPVLSSPSAPGTTAPIQQLAADGDGFHYLKRDLVRLLGILCHGCKAVQDRARDCGGIEVVMNLCVIDERNPYLREHAIFTLHSLLKDNVENQAVVDAIKLTSQWDENLIPQDGLVARVEHSA